jgi:hypothetical protein
VHRVGARIGCISFRVPYIALAAALLWVRSVIDGYRDPAADRFVVRAICTSCGLASGPSLGSAQELQKAEAREQPERGVL